MRLYSQDEVVIQARSWIGVPFHHQGRSKALGVDCAGFVVELARELRILPSDFKETVDYRRLPDGRLEGLIQGICRKTEKAEPGTLILFKWPSQNYPSHVGICTGPTLIHAYQRADQVIENGYRGHWLRDTHGVYRLPGVEYV